VDLAGDWDTAATLDAGQRVELVGGWDSAATLVEGRWVERRPRRDEVAGQLRREVRLMPWLAPRLPLLVPVPYVLSEVPLVVRHELVPGEPLASPGAPALPDAHYMATNEPSILLPGPARKSHSCIDPQVARYPGLARKFHSWAEHGRRLGAFLRALHDCPVREAVRHGLLDARDAAGEHARTLDDFRARVVPLVPVGQRGTALALLDELREPPGDTVVHGDLGPEHVLVRDGVLSGVIDFGDAHAGDAAIDLAWALYGTPAAFAGALAAAYGVVDSQRERALAWHRLGPWYEVTHGLDTDDAATVRGGLAGLLSRLGR
jgi:aminoglycoside phosphotransferase (APT) family kinase protein